METQTRSKVSKGYLLIVLMLMFILPVICISVELFYQNTTPLSALVGKWFVFWGIGVRLFTAGLKQVIKPAFTLKDIFHIDSTEGLAIVKELGFANICFGAAGIISIFKPEWRTAAAFTGGLYMGIAGVNHIIKKPAGANEVIAMVSDIFIFLVLAIYLCC